MAMDAAQEALEHEYTQCLQDIDGNLVKAVDAGTKLLQNVKVFDLRMRDVASCVSVWSQFFGRVARVNAAQAEPQAAAEEAATSPDAPRESKAAGSGGKRHGTSADLSSELPPTPQMPRFSKSFAHTPMGRRLNESYASEESSALDLGGSSSSFLGNVSPETAKMVEAYRTPRLPSASDARSPPTRVWGSGSGHQPNILDISDITPATPGTPEDGDYGGDSAFKAAQLLRFGTPGKQVPSLLLSSGAQSGLKSSSARGAGNPRLDQSDISSNPATPTLSSPHRHAGAPLDTSLLLEEDGEGEACDENRPELGNANAGLDESPALALGKRRSAVQAASRASVGTPLSASVAKKRRHSLPRHLRDASDDEDAAAGGDSLLLDESFDESAPEFSLDLFPKLFQSGEGAAQVTSVYSQFEADHALTLAQLLDKMPGFERARLELMLDMLVSKGLLRPFRLDGQLFWRAPEAAPHPG